MKRIISILAATLACAACQPPPEGTQVAAVPPAEPVCHDFATPVAAGGRPEQARGQACEQPDGSWQVVQNTPGLPAQNYVLEPPGQPAAAASPTCTATTEPVPTQSAALQQLYGSAHGRRAAAAGLHRGLPATRRELEDHAEYAGAADAGLPGAAARVLALPLRLPVPGRLRVSRVLSVLARRALVFWPRAVDRRRAEVPPFPLWLSSRLRARFRPRFWP